MHRASDKRAASRAPRSICDLDLTPLVPRNSSFHSLLLPFNPPPRVLRQSSPVNNDHRKLPGRRKIPRRVHTLSETDDAAALAVRSDRPVIYDGRRHADRSFLPRDYFDARKLRRRERERGKTGTRERERTADCCFRWLASRAFRALCHMTVIGSI